MKVSIIMPVYNVEEYLPRAIESALRQTVSSFELILVNDGSTDGSGAICDEYQEKDSRIQVIHQKNQGSGPARNAGLQKAKGTYIYFADPDDYFEQTLLEDNLAKIEQTQADVLVFGFYEEKYRQNGQKKQIQRLPNDSETQNQETFRTHFQTYYSFYPYALWNKLYRRQFLIENQCSFVNQKVGQDALFNIQVMTQLGKTSTNSTPYYHYIEREESAVTSYRSNRFELEYNIASAFHQMMKVWEKEEEYRELTIKEYWNAVYLELLNLNSPKCPLNKEEKVKQMNSILQNSTIKQALKEYPLEKEQNPFVKQLVRSLRQNKPARALRLMGFRLDVEKKIYPLFVQLKEKLYRE